MNIEEAIENCQISLNQIKHYDPDPFYVDYFFNEFIISVNNSLNGIFEEANRDFGLFISKNISEQSFVKKAKTKQDHKAIKFSEWYSACCANRPSKKISCIPKPTLWKTTSKENEMANSDFIKK